MKIYDFDYSATPTADSKSVDKIVKKSNYFVEIG